MLIIISCQQIIAWSKQYFTKLVWKSLRAYNKKEISWKHSYYI